VELAVAWLRGHRSALLQNFLDVVATATADASAPAATPAPADERLLPS